MRKLAERGFSIDEITVGLDELHEEVRQMMLDFGLVEPHSRVSCCCSSTRAALLETLSDVDETTKSEWRATGMFKKPGLSGYHFIAYMNKRFRFLPSAGSVYSTLYSMERDELIKGTLENGKRTYKITEKDSKTISVILASADFKNIASLLL